MTPWLDRMRRDWDRRAEEDAHGAIYTRDSAADVAGFDESGRANYDQLVRPFLPILLDGRPASGCRAVEIGCGAGRMTRCFAEAFGEVHAVDVSPAMIELARRRLAEYPNVHLYAGSGADLAPLPDAFADLVFSYIVFQHIPSREVIESYVGEAARVLRPGGAFKFQLHGGQSPEYRAHIRDTWLGETYSLDEARAMIGRHGFGLLAAEGIGTQYFVLTAKKSVSTASYILPGEAWAEERLIEGWGAAVDQSWRPIERRCAARLDVPAGGDLRFFLGIYFWPGPPVRLTVAGLGHAAIDQPGDHYFEWDAASAASAVVTIELDPPPPRPPAVRSMGFYEKIHGTSHPGRAYS